MFTWLPRPQSDCVWRAGGVYGRGLHCAGRLPQFLRVRPQDGQSYGERRWPDLARLRFFSSENGFSLLPFLIFLSLVLL